MELSWKITALALVAVAFCVLIRDNQKPLSVLLSLIACIGILLLVITILEPILEVFKKLVGLSGVNDEIVAPMLKVAGVGLMTQLSAGICQDAGEGALAKTVELCGIILAMYAALPLLLAVLELVENMIGGLG